MFHSRKISLCVSVIVFLTAAPARAITLGSFNNPFASSPVVGRMGTIELTVKQVSELLRTQSPEVRQSLLGNPENFKEWLRSELMRRALLEETKKVEWNKRPEVALAMELAREQAVIDSFLAARAEPEKSFPSAKEIETAYQANLAQFVIPEQLLLAQILIRVAENASVEENNRASNMTREIVAKLKEGMDFGTLAGLYSQDEGSKGKRGELDWVAEPGLSPQIREEVKTIKTGWVGKPLRTPYGWQILKVLERRPATARPLGEVRDAIARALRALQTNENRARYLESLKKDHPLAIDDAALKTVK